MSLVSSSRFLLVCLLTAAFCLAQEKPERPAPPPAEAPPAPPVIATPKPPQEPPVLEDGGFSIEPFYWFSKQQPALFGGKKALTTFQNLDYPGSSNRPLGGEIGIPTGHSNTLRLSYFRVQGHADSTAAQDVNLFGETFSAGDALSANYLVQNAKVSWDYLSYTWRPSAGHIHLKTLYELQYLNIGTNIWAPFRQPVSDANGNVDTFTTAGSRTVFYPTLGMELESMLGKHFRWEIKGSGFGWPHRGNIWDVQGTIAVRFGSVEILGGEKAFHFKTSPQAEQYFVQTLQGAYVGIRYYWGQHQ
ncbi:MAG TPA: hypothetical protein VGK64_15865 [Bryobacteraceae bacterium]